MYWMMHCPSQLKDIEGTIEGLPKWVAEENESTRKGNSAKSIGYMEKNLTGGNGGMEYKRTALRWIKPPPWMGRNPDLKHITRRKRRRHHSRYFPVAEFSGASSYCNFIVILVNQFNVPRIKKR